MTISRPFNPCIAVPAYNHRDGLKVVLTELARSGYPVIVIDDGSTDGTRELLSGELCLPERCTVLHRLSNGGKGAALKDGVREAIRYGYTHLVQIDADGQHCNQDLDRFISAAREAPNAVVCGRPLFGEAAPPARVWGRELSNVLVWIETRSMRVRDALCGFRVYPIHWCHEVITSETIADRMDFDVEVVVRLCKAGAAVVNVPTEVTYPKDGISHYRYLTDNLKMVALHTSLLPRSFLPASLPGGLRSKARPLD